ncbi:MAG: CDP-alcohol phosphatidyltransferase family protein [Deltaproteobacteria bacterium]|nr:CDP-alcohol phosphatidyltransferase family protein [Deltaproteobacteria bacterium]
MARIVEGRTEAGRRDGAAAAAARDAPAVDVMIFVPSDATWRRAGTPGGLSLLERQLKQLVKLDRARVVLLVRDGDPEPAVSVPGAIVSVRRVPEGVGDLAGAVAATPDRPHVFLALAADRLVDLRVLRALLDRDRTTFVSCDGSRQEPVAWIRAADVARHGAAVAAHAERCLLEEIDPYSAELRGDAAPYVVTVGTTEERRAGWDVLLDHVQKRALDLPGQYFDAPFENFLVRRFAPTSVTPNQITLFTLVLAGVVAALFYGGWLRVGVLLALVVGVLDGVDGKLARLKLQTSKLGELEHVGDFFYENGWYLALASHFGRAGGRADLWYAGWLLVACDLVDNLLYLAAQRATGRMLDELTPFDRRFRAVAGRRNVYVMILVGGFFTGRPAEAFVGVVAWAVATVAVHAFRVAWVFATAPRAARPR